MNTELKPAMLQSNSEKIKFLPELILFAIFGIIQLSHIDLDFWNDEIYSIKNFILTSTVETVSDYHSPNNHIFFNLINNLYLRVVGVDTLHQLMEDPWILRIIPLVFSFVTMIFTYLIGRRFVSRTAGLLALIILITSMTYYNFSIQIRGYGLSMMLGVIMVYYLLTYRKKAQRKHLVAITITTVLMFYTIPSNLYFLLSIVLALAILLLFNRPNKDVLRNKYALSIYAVLFGVLLTLIFYAPIFTEVFANEHVQFGDRFRFTDFKEKVLYAGYGLVYNRWFVVSLALIGLIVGIKKLKDHRHLLLLSFATILIPLVAVWVTGQTALPRIFTVCVPFVALFMGTSIFIGWIKYFGNSQNRGLVLVTCVLLITTISLNFQFGQIDRRMLSDIQEGTRTQSLYFQYYTSRYEPLQAAQALKTSYSIDKRPIVVIGYETHGFFTYLDKFKLPFHSKEEMDSLFIEYEELYVVTHYPFDFMNRNDLDAELLNDELSYHNVLVVSKK
jgi:hypothetical protein